MKRAFAFVLLFSITIALLPFRDHVVLTQLAKQTRAPTDFKTEWFTQTLDHFNWAKTDATFQQRWLYDGEYSTSCD